MTEKQINALEAGHELVVYRGPSRGLPVVVVGVTRQLSALDHHERVTGVRLQHPGGDFSWDATPQRLRTHYKVPAAR